jgi:broad specificity phosphatase PhoE
MVQSVYVLRHAHRFDFEMSRSEWHELAQRSTDPPLSALGQSQASEVGEFFEQLRDESIAHVLSSPYQRCIQTAHPIASALDTTIKVDLGLQEIPPSFFRGPEQRHLNRVVADVPLEERANYFPLVDTEYCTTISADLAHAADARGIQTRHWLCLQQFMQTHVRESESVVVVTHGWVRTCTAYAAALQLPKQTGHANVGMAWPHIAGRADHHSSTAWCTTVRDCGLLPFYTIRCECWPV